MTALPRADLQALLEAYKHLDEGWSLSVALKKVDLSETSIRGKRVRQSAQYQDFKQYYLKLKGVSVCEKNSSALTQVNMLPSGYQKKAPSA